MFFLIGASVWYVLKLCSDGMARFFKLFFLLAMFGNLIFGNENLDVRPSGVYENEVGEIATRTGSAFKMFLDAPLTGVGLF